MRDVNAGWEEIEHAADIGLHIWAPSRRELFHEAAVGMINAMLNTGSVRELEERRIDARGDDYESLLVGWLDEILFAFDAEHFAPRNVMVLDLNQDHVTGVLRGEKFDPDRHEVLNAIKAVTWHDLAIERKNGVFHVTVIFDV